MKANFNYIKSRLDNQKIRELIGISLDRLAVDLSDEFVSVTSDMARTLATLTGLPTLRWRMFLEKVSMKCPSCSNTLVSECARVSCAKCREELIVRSDVLLEICKGCISYSNKSCPGAMVDSRKFGKPQLSAKRTGWIIEKGRRSESYE